MEKKSHFNPKYILLLLFTASAVLFTSCLTDKEEKNNQLSMQQPPGQNGDSRSMQGMPPEGQPPQGERPEGSPPGPPPEGKMMGPPPGGKMQQPPQDGMQGPPPGDHTDAMQVTALLKGLYTLDGGEDSRSGEDMTASGENQSVIYLLNGASLELKDSKLYKTGAATNTEGSEFYGLNAAVLAADGSSLVMSATDIKTGADGANAVFSTGEGSNISLKSINIVTTEDSSRGLDATMGGTIEAQDIRITTSGAHCAAVATDRGEGTITVTDAVLKTEGEGSPGVYSTGNISLKNATIVSKGSEAAVVEGRNSISFESVEAKGFIKSGVMLYQSFSGDAETGTAVFSMDGGSLRAEEGPIFYITNTRAEINLDNAELSSASGILLKAGPDRWGTEGSNGGKVSLTARNQFLNGIITADDTSSINIVLNDNSELKGSIDNASVALDETSIWVVTGNSSVNTLTVPSEDSISLLIKDNGHTITYDTESNKFLNGKTISLAGGGRLVPADKI